jgi:hypothetical protein
MKSNIFWDVTPCSLIEVHRRFGGIYCLHIRGRKVSQEINQPEAGGKQVSITFWFIAWVRSIFRRSGWWHYFPPKCRSTSIELHGFTSQKVALFIVILVIWSLYGNFKPGAATFRTRFVKTVTVKYSYMKVTYPLPSWSRGRSNGEETDLGLNPWV